MKYALLGFRSIMTASYTVECDDHGPMERDDMRLGYSCEQCTAYISDEEIYRLTTRVRALAPPTPIVVVGGRNKWVRHQKWSGPASTEPS